MSDDGQDYFRLRVTKDAEGWCVEYHDGVHKPGRSGFSSWQKAVDFAFRKPRWYER